MLHKKYWRFFSLTCRCLPLLTAKEPAVVGVEGPFHFKQRSWWLSGGVWPPWSIALTSFLFSRPHLEPCTLDNGVLVSTIPFPPSDLATILAKPKNLLLPCLLCWQNDHVFHLCYGFPVSWVACKEFSSSRHSTSLWLMLLAPTLNGLPNIHASQHSLGEHISALSGRTQILKTGHLCFLLSSFAVSSEKLIPSEIPYLCPLRGSHLYRKFGPLYGPVVLPHILCDLDPVF